MRTILSFATALLLSSVFLGAQDFKLNESGYFNYKGVDAMAFNDYYPEGHQGGISMILQGKRVITNGDIRFEPTPGQWQPLPKMVDRKVSPEGIVTSLAWPDSTRHMTSHNSFVYPDINLTYTVSLIPAGSGFDVVIDLDQPIPEQFIGKVGFNLEFFPGWLFGKPWLMDDKSGIFPQQPNGPVESRESYLKYPGKFSQPGKQVLDTALNNSGYKYSPYTADSEVCAPYCVGQKFTSCPDDPYTRLTIISYTEPLKLYDGRLNHNNGWFVLRSEVAPNVTKGAVKWHIEPSVVDDWIYKPVVQTSQIGYAPAQEKVAVIETDKRDTPLPSAYLFKMTPEGEKVVREVAVIPWNGQFLRYQYLKADFSDVKEEGMYKLRYGASDSPVFRIASDVFDRGVWQPVIEYFLPVQMCHMRVMEKYRVWHDYCHMDDAMMALPGNYLDGYAQAEDTYGKAKAGEKVYGLNVGGWHDAGDFDLRVESQSGEIAILSRALENFHPDIDATDINQNTHQVEIHQCDGVNDILQQIEHGALTVVNGYLALGRLYRGIIAHTARQYVMLGDASAMTDGELGNADDRWVFTENNPMREISTATDLAVTYRSLKGYNDTLANHCLEISKELFEVTNMPANMDPRWARMAEGIKLPLAVELYFSTGEQKYFDYLIERWDLVVRSVAFNGWQTARFAKSLEGKKKYAEQVKAYRAALVEYKAQLAKQVEETPYGVPYRPAIWGAGWTIQEFGFKHFFLVDAYPDIFTPEPVTNALNFVLGCHPGSNQQSFASGVGAESATVGYGLNRADWAYIPGGVVSGTALIRPDFPELLVWPYLWQQVEYVLGGGSSHYMFLVLATQKLTKK